MRESVLRATAYQRATAYHEAGHVVAAWRTGLRQKTATIVPTTNAAGSAETRSIRGVTLGVISSARARVHAENYITVLLAGPAAQRKHDPRSRWRESGGSDYRVASDLASELNAEWNDDEARSARACLRWLDVVACRIIDIHWPQVEAVANELIEKLSLSGTELEDVIQASIQASMRAAQGYQPLDLESTGVEFIAENGGGAGVSG